MLRDKKVKGIHKVIDLKHLKKQHSTKEAKQKLLDQFDMFIAESNCIKLLYHALGKDVYKKRR